VIVNIHGSTTIKISYNGCDDPQVLPLMSRAVLRAGCQFDDDESIWS
jgi:hypothetical protein